MYFNKPTSLKRLLISPLVRLQPAQRDYWRMLHLHLQTCVTRSHYLVTSPRHCAETQTAKLFVPVKRATSPSCTQTPVAERVQVGREQWEMSANHVRLVTLASTAMTLLCWPSWSFHVFWEELCSSSSWLCSYSAAGRDARKTKPTSATPVRIHRVTETSRGRPASLRSLEPQLTGMQLPP